MQWLAAQLVAVLIVLVVFLVVDRPVRAGLPPAALPPAGLPPAAPLLDVPPPKQYVW